MRNFNTSGFYTSRIVVINPILKPETIISGAASWNTTKSISRQNQTGDISIRLETKQYAPRQKVMLHISADTAQSLLLMSVNARLVEEELNAPDPWGRSGTSRVNSIDKLHFLPDLRGELISGAVINKKTGKPVSKSLVSLSSPSKHFRYFVSTTDSAGRYYFNARGMASDFALVKVNHHEKDDLLITPENNFLEDPSAFAPPKFAIDSSMRTLIMRRYLPMQVENAFYSAKKDSVPPSREDKRFFEADKIYNLDDFMRFPTMEDIFREIIPEIVLKARDGQFTLSIMSLITGERFSGQPLMLIDGIPMADPNVVMKYDPLRVKTISIVTRHYFYGGLEADGIISIETYDGDAKNVNTEEMWEINYVQPIPPKVYYTPAYDGKKDLTRIPDFRTQLYWNPFSTVTSGESTTLEFHTSDVTGKYFIEVVGTTSSGKKIYWRETFEVK
jgi:hypothetical protein